MVKRRVFYSFHYELDSWRLAQVRIFETVDGRRPTTDNDWEAVRGGGHRAITEWIDNQMHGKICVVVLVEAMTAGLKWIKYEIRRAWEIGSSLVGIYIHRLKEAKGEIASKGRNQFSDFKLDGTPFMQLAKCDTPSGTSSTEVYNDISQNIEK